MSLSAAFYTHVAAALGYAIFVALLAVRGARARPTAIMALAAAATAGWALCWVLYDLGLAPEWIVLVAPGIRDGCWIAVVLVILAVSRGRNALWLRLTAISAVVVGIDIVFSGLQLDLGSIGGITIDYQVTRIVTTILGLILIENLLRNVSPEEFWAIRSLGIGLIATFAFNIILRIPQFLTHTADEGLVAAQPVVMLIVLPLYVMAAVRSPTLGLNIHSSRRVIFHTATLVVAGVLLQGTAVAAYYVRNYGGATATVLAVLVIFSMLVALAVAVTSGTIRSALRTFINENFFAYKYDYRVEWQKFIQSLSAWDDGGVAMGALRTLSELMDTPGGALWSFRERWGQFMPVAQWSFPLELAPLGADDPAVRIFDDESLAYLDLDLTDAEHAELAKPWREKFPDVWMIVPLRYRSSLTGIAVLNPPRVGKRLTWEDRNLIALVSMQLAAYLVQDETAQALADARQLEDFNKRIAFILHDIKNTIGQLSLIARNAEQFGDNAEFRKDMVLTIEHSVSKLHELLARLRGEAGALPAATAEGTNLTALVADFVARKRSIGMNIRMRDAEQPAFVSLSDRNAFVSVLEHVVTNAVEATPAGSPVHVRIENGGGWVRVNVDDQGAGMTAQFIAKELFRPLRTTKGKGMGIGAYQAKETMRDLGGDIEVSSKVGEGTTITLLLPSSSQQQRRISA
jgi:putative PEP-CTERM system histidine kinase